MKREHLLGLGDERSRTSPSSCIVDRRVWMRDIDRLHDLLERHGDSALRAAFARGLEATRLRRRIHRPLHRQPHRRGRRIQQELFS